MSVQIVLFKTPTLNHLSRNTLLDEPKLIQDTFQCSLHCNSNVSWSTRAWADRAYCCEKTLPKRRLTRVVFCSPQGFEATDLNNTHNASVRAGVDRNDSASVASTRTHGQHCNTGADAHADARMAPEPIPALSIAACAGVGCCVCLNEMPGTTSTPNVDTTFSVCYDPNDLLLLLDTLVRQERSLHDLSPGDTPNHKNLCSPTCKERSFGYLFDLWDIDILW